MISKGGCNFKVDVKRWNSLTLIRAAGGVYDFRNFEEVYLCNGSSSDLQISGIPRKTSREYILLNMYFRAKNGVFGDL
jgi:hypothetical protein